MPASLSRTSFSLAVAAFLSTVTVGTANAKECKADSDCANGFECVLGAGASGSGGSGSTGTSVGDPGAGAATGTSGSSSGAGAATGTACAGANCVGISPMPTVPPPPVQVDGGDVVGPSTPPVVTTGSCQVKILICSTKADCPAPLDCVKETAMVTAPTCAPDTTCGTTVPPTNQTGTCKAVCNVDADCPAPLTCKVQGATCSGGGSVSSDGTVTTMPETCTGGAKICSYQPVTCSSDTECKDSNYQCAKVSEYESCSGSAPANCPKSTGDAGTCTTTAPEPPVCTSTVVNNCMPKEINCDAGQTCPVGWSCFDFSYFEGASIPGWSTQMPSKACLPDGLILAIKGQAGGGSSATYSGSTPTNGGTDSIALGDGGTKGPVTTDGGVPPQVAPVATSDGGAEATSHTVSGGGCAVGGTPRGSFELWLTLGLAGVVLRLVRRRK